MKSKVDRFLIHSNVQVQRYDIFERKVYDKESQHYIPQNPRIWNDDPKAIHGKDYLEYSIINNIDKNYDLYAIWPEVSVYAIYNLFNSSKKIETKIDKEHILMNMSSDIEGFKGWLDKNMEFHYPETTIIPKSNIQMFLSTCQEISISYDLNDGYLQDGKKAQTQSSLYSKWINNDYKIEDINASILIRADDPTSRSEGTYFGYWMIDSQHYHKGDRVDYKENKIAKAQWLYEPDYKLFESIAFNGDDPGEKYGQIKVIGQSESSVKITKRYEAIPEDGYKFDSFKVQLFDGYEVQPEQTYSGSTQKEVSITKYDPIADDLTTKLNVYATTIACFSEDLDSWFKIEYQDGHVRLVKKPSNPGITVTNATLQTAGVNNIVRIQFPTNDVEHVENGIFANCTSLVEVQIATGLREFPKDMCKNDSMLTTISYPLVPSNLTTIGESAFEMCSKLSNIEQQLIDNITTVGNRAFYGTSLASFSFSSNITSIGNDIFYNASQLKDITLKSNTLGVFSSNALDGSSIERITLTSIPSTSII